jgi:chorismate dehydratase
MIKLGVIEVLNVLPVYYTILKQKYDSHFKVVKGIVTELNEKLYRGDIDVSVISSFEYAKHFDLYYILPDLSISADGPVNSIYLFLDKPIDELNRDKIKLTTFSFTSVHLIQFLLKDYQVEFTNENEESVVGQLLIADQAIRRFYQRRDRFVYDLSELWKAKTGLPFVFALWCVRKDSFARHPRETLKLYRELLSSKKRSLENICQMACEYYQGVFLDQAACEHYLANLKYEFSEKYQQGFLLFQEKMVELKKLDRVAPLHFLPLDGRRSDAEPDQTDYPA